MVTGMRLGPRRKIVKREYYRTSSHTRLAGASVLVTLECGHQKHYKASQEPTLWARCPECEEGG